TAPGRDYPRRLRRSREDSRPDPEASGRRKPARRGRLAHEAPPARLSLIGCYPHPGPVGMAISTGPPADRTTGRTGLSQAGVKPPRTAHDDRDDPGSRLLISGGDSVTLWESGSSRRSLCHVRYGVILLANQH